MSKLHPPVEQTNQRAKPLGKVLKRRRAKPLHPEEIYARLTERARTLKPPDRWTYPFGWLLIFRDKSGNKIRQELSAKLSYAQAIEIRDDEMEENGYEMAWLIQRTAQKEV